MEPRILQIAARIKGMRELLGISEEEMAAAAGVTAGEYRDLEGGKSDFSFTFLYKCAERFGIDIVEILTGENPKLRSYTVTRAGKGLPIKRRAGFNYEHIAAHFKGKQAEPFVVTAPYVPGSEDAPIALSAHEGQELDFVISGRLKVRIEDHTEVLEAGDSIYYDSSRGHGMIALDDSCTFLAVVMKKERGAGR